MRFLVRIGDPGVFAYATPRDMSYYLVREGSFWAYEHDGSLWRAGTREELAQRDGMVFFDGDLPMFFEL